MALEIPEQFGAVEITLDPQKPVPRLGLAEPEQPIAVMDAAVDFDVLDAESFADAARNIYMWQLQSQLGADLKQLSLKKAGLEMDALQLGLRFKPELLEEMEQQSILEMVEPGSVEMMVANNRCLLEGLLRSLDAHGHSVKFTG